MTHTPPSFTPPDTFLVRIRRQDDPGRPPYWEKHRVAYESDMNVISVLQRIAEKAETAEGKKVAPVAWDCSCLEEVCGACTMIINGRVRQACSALVDRLLQDHPGEIELRPMEKFPVVRDLVVDRLRLFEALKTIQAWVPVDSYHHFGPGARQPQAVQEQNYRLSHCMTCGCCVDACPQYRKIEVVRRNGETDEQFAQRRAAAYQAGFLGSQAIGQVVLHNSHPTGRYNSAARLEALTGPGGLQHCGNAQNCVTVCPKDIPLTTAIGRAGRAITIYAIRRFFEQ